MKSKILVFLLVLSFMLVGATSSAFAAPVDTYLPGVSWGSGWSDAEKNLDSPTGDTEMCWAASSSNVLNYTGWGAVGGFANEDAIYSDFVTHWTNLGGDSIQAYTWWFYGADYAQDWGVTGLSQPDQERPSWNGYIGMTESNFWSGDYLRYTNGGTAPGTDITLFTDLDDFIFQQISDGYGTNISVKTLDGHHAMTAWGYGYDEDHLIGSLTGYCLYLTDSDDNEYGGASALNTLDTYWLNQVWDSSVGGYVLKLYLDGAQSPIGYLDNVRALAMYGEGPPPPPPGEPVPEPATILLLGSGLAGLFGFGRRKFKRS